VLVDEYQDTNHAQYALIRELVQPPEPGAEPAELCVVGDADQSIYAFRGATIRNIEEFERDFPDARTILLEQNYRSTQTILSAANAVIAHNPHRRDKRLWSAAGDGEPVVGYVADNEHDEAAFVASEIDRLVDAGDARFGDVAVFYRTNNSSRVFEEVFIRLGLPYKVVGGVRFYERREVRDALAYLRVLVNPEDTVSLRRILNVPKRGIGDRAQTASGSPLPPRCGPRPRTRTSRRCTSARAPRSPVSWRCSTSCARGSTPGTRHATCWRRCWTAAGTGPSWTPRRTRRTPRGWTTSTSS
jgi:DNA helicase-2/ATP-dependent DNA helicase PcrA